ncbi:MAG: hypothetical protein E7022_05930 [Desulfovibrio desulfuricans]|nr:hypothetical protein [Desulfovibrio desulfuricans]
MRAVLGMGAALLASLAVNAALITHAGSLRAERDHALAEIAVLEQARAADADAIATSNQARQEAAQTAQERRDALHEVEKNAADLSDSDFLCRLRGVCLPNGNQGADASGNPAAGLPGADAAGRHGGQ